jgi:hypothetical protein
MPATYGHGATSGDTSGWPKMDARGNCYQGYHYGRGGSPGSGSTGSHYDFFRLPPQDDTLQRLPVTQGDEEGNVFSNNITYMPAGNGMPGRLVIQAGVSYHSWAALFSGLAGETSREQIVRFAVP